MAESQQSPPTFNDEYWMTQALAAAKNAMEMGDVPVGAVLVKDNQLIASAGNAPITQCDPTAHAEVLVLQQAAKLKNNYRLLGTTLYVTLEPCLMCVGALVHARVSRIVFGAFDKKSGAVTSAIKALNSDATNYHIEYLGGVLEPQCVDLLQSFFKQRRAEKKHAK